MPSPGGNQLPKMCCPECFAQICATLQIEQGTSVVEEVSPTEALLPEDDVSVIVGNIYEVHEVASTEDLLSDDSIIIIMEPEDDLNEDYEASFQGDGNDLLPGGHPNNT
ncbi:uncharacterized protein LOC122818634 [Drosophila biarmipes]|uniref:uncharacterized protein LOC122818634 n=1 Tax=Drosophila biarmipes TaxID=125945 RepID=UPI001CDA6B88|nr:uncharacterized protein LOC122818634 [Drosophila biarmipes]XP_043949183.1 uncharacterized protein LOC122818634 [Drosophila biarmipes]XP_050746380.1 uncharacterized protein LOC122818634 [Drosophila biarmipes]